MDKAFEAQANKVRTVVAAALHLDGSTFTKPRPARHSDVIESLARMGGTNALDWEQGYLLSDGSFVDRERAFLVAKEARQIPEESCAGVLYSDDVW